VNLTRRGMAPGGPAPSAGAARPFRRLAEPIWRVLISMRVAIAVLLALAALAFVGAILVQAPPSALADPEAKAAWLESIRPKYGPWTPILDQLQLFTIFGSAWFSLLAAYLAASLVACVVHRSTRLWHTSVRPKVDPPGDFFERATQRETIALHQGAAEALPAIQGALRNRRYRTLVQDDGSLHLYADRNRWGPFASVAGHAGLLLILAGAVIGSTLGFSEPELLVAEGFTAAVPTRTGLTVKLEAFRDAYYPTTGAPSDFASDLVLYRDGAEVARRTVRVNDPLRYDGLSFYQSFYGPAAVMNVVDGSGATVLHEGVPLAWTEDGRSLATVVLPGTDLTALLVGTAGSADPVVRPGQLLVELHRQGDEGPVASGILDQGRAATLAGLNVVFERESLFAGLKVASDPGTPLVWLGSTLLVAGFGLGLAFRHRRVWGRLVARPGGGSILSLASIDRHDAGLDAEFTGLVGDIRQASTTPASTTPASTTPGRG